MNRYDGRIKVVHTDKMCFPVDPITLEPLGASVYDAYPWGEPTACEVITSGEWNARRTVMRVQARRRNKT